MLKFNTPQEERFFQTLSPQQQAQYIQIQQQQQAEQHIQNELHLESQLNQQLKQQIPQVVNQQNHTNHLQLHSNMNPIQSEQLPISPSPQIPNQIQNQQLFQSQSTPTQIPQQSFQIQQPSIQQQFPQFASNSTTTYSPSPGVHVTTVHTTIPIQQHSHINQNHNYDQQQQQQQQQQFQQQQVINHAIPFLHNIFPSINLTDSQLPPTTIHFFKIDQDGRVIHDDPNVSNQLQTMLQIANPQQESQLQSQSQTPPPQLQQPHQPLQLQSHHHQHSFDQTPREQFQFRQPGKYRDQLTLPHGSDQLIARYARINPFHRNSLHHYYINNKKLHQQFKPGGISNIYPSNFYYPTQNELESIGWIRDELKTNQIDIENDNDHDNNECNMMNNNGLTSKQINSGLQLLFPEYQTILSSPPSNPVVSKISSVVSDLFKTSDKNNNNNDNNDDTDDNVDDEHKAAQLLAEQQYINEITPSYEDEVAYNKRFDLLNQLVDQRQPARNIVNFNNLLSDLFGIPVSNISVHRYDIHPQQHQQYQHAQNDENYQQQNSTPKRRKQVNPLELLFGIDDDFDHDHIDPFHPHDNHHHSHHRHHPISPIDLLFGAPGFLHRHYHQQSPQQEYEQSPMNNDEHNHIQRRKHPLDDIFFQDNIFTDPMFNRRRSNQGIQMGLDPMGFRSHHRFGFDDDDGDFGFINGRDPFASILSDRSPIDSLMMGGLFPHPGQGFNTNDDHPFKNIINNNSSSSSSSISSFSSSSSSTNGGRGGVKSWSSSTVTKVGPDGIARTERQEEEIIDDGSKDGKKHRKIVEKQVRGVDTKRHADIAEVHRVESDLTSGETKVVHKRQLGDKEHERVQEMNVFQGLLEQKENNGQLTNINIKDNVRGLDLNEVNTFDEEFTRALEETTHTNQPIVNDDKKKKKGLFW